MSEHSTIQQPAPGNPIGIGGWLLLPLLHLAVNVGQVGYGIALGIQHTVAGRAAPVISSGAPLYLLFLFVAFSIGICLYAIYTLVRFFRRKMDVPVLMMVFYVLVAILAAINLGSNWLFPIAPITQRNVIHAVGSLFGAIVGAIIWIAYFRSSVRVRNTFVN